MSTHAKEVYFAKLAEQAERYDEMAEHMRNVALLAAELCVEERSLLSVASKNAVGGRRAAWRTVASIEQREESEGHETQATFAREYGAKLKLEIQQHCDALLKLLDTPLLEKASNDEAKVFYQKMKADYYRYLAECAEGDAKARATESAREAYEEATRLAWKELPVTHPIRLGLVLSRCVFQYEVFGNLLEACKMAQAAFEEALGDLDNVPEEHYRESTLLMQLLRDNLTLWTSNQEAAVSQ